MGGSSLRGRDIQEIQATSVYPKGSEKGFNWTSPSSRGHKPHRTAPLPWNLERLSRGLSWQRSQKAGTLDPSHRRSSRTSLVHSRPHLSQSYQNQTGQTSIDSFRICHTHTQSPQPSPTLPSTRILTRQSFPAHGEHLQQFPWSYNASPQDHKQQYGTWQKPTTPSHYIRHIGRLQWYGPEKRSFTSTPHSVLVHDPHQMDTGIWKTARSNSTEWEALALSQNRLTTTYFSRFNVNTLLNTISTENSGHIASQHRKENIKVEEDYGMGELCSVMAQWRNLR